MTAFTIELPQDLGLQVQSAGLLNQSKIVPFFEQALKQNRRNELFNTIRTAQQIGEDLIPYAAIQAEIIAARRIAHSV